MKKHNYKVGDIILNVWGFEQTNTDYYQVDRVSKSSIWLREIDSRIEPKGKLAMQGTSYPLKDKFLGGKTLCKLVREDNTVAFDYGVGIPVPPEAGHSCSWYA